MGSAAVILKAAFRQDRKEVGTAKALSMFNDNVEIEMVSAQEDIDSHKNKVTLLKGSALLAAGSAVGLAFSDAQLLSSISALAIWPAFKRIPLAMESLEKAEQSLDELNDVSESVRFEAHIRNTDGSFYEDNPDQESLIFEHVGTKFNP
jgi:hypothetical protein